MAGSNVGSPTSYPLPAGFSKFVEAPGRTGPLPRGTIASQASVNGNRAGRQPRLTGAVGISTLRNEASRR